MILKLFSPGKNGILLCLLCSTVFVNEIRMIGKFLLCFGYKDKNSDEFWAKKRLQAGAGAGLFFGGQKDLAKTADLCIDRSV